jgi:hypothetical protein
MKRRREKQLSFYYLFILNIIKRKESSRVEHGERVSRAKN